MNTSKACAQQIKENFQGDQIKYSEGNPKGNAFNLKVREYLKPEPIRWSANTGWIILYLFVLEGITGTLLLLYYRPTVSEAYESIQQITNTLHYGWLIRGIHIWGTHLLVIALLFHLTQKLIGKQAGLNQAGLSQAGLNQADLRQPGLNRLPPRSYREFAWISGILMIALVGIFGATGYLLSWTQISYWSTTFVTQLITALPCIGEPLKILARGGADISQITFSRFFALHILIIPLLFTFLAGIHIFFARESLIPRDLLFQILILLVLIAALFSLSTFFPPRLYPKADPFKTFLNVKPEWYFLASYETFHLLCKIPMKGYNSVALGILLHLGVFLLFLLLPFLTPSSYKKRRVMGLTLTTLSLVVFLILTILGARL